LCRYDSATSADDPAVAQAEAILKCVPPSVSVSGGDSIHGGGGGGGGGGGRGGGGDDATIAAVRDTIAVIKQLPDFGVELAPAQLRWGLYTFANSVDP
jgi:hypothetical protein